MRIVFTLLLSIAFLVPRAQTQAAHLPVVTGAPGLGVGGWGFTPWQPFVPYALALDGTSGKGWQVRPFASLSAGYIFWGGGISYVSAPVGVMAFRPLSSNFTAFGAATLAPTVFDFNRFAGQAIPGNNLGLGVNASVTGGLIYTNEAKTFSISGSISVERGSSPVYLQNRPNNTKQY